MPDKYTGNGYIQKKYCSSKALFEYLSGEVNGLLSGVADSERGLYYHFTVHLFISMLIEDDYTGPEGPFIPIYSRLIEKQFSRKFEVNKLKEAGIIKIKPHNTYLGKCREFQIITEIYVVAKKLHSRDVKTRWRELYKPKKHKKAADVNLIDGKYWRTPVTHNLKYFNEFGDDFNTPSLIRKSIKAIQPFPFNPVLAGRFVNALEQKMKRCKREFDAAEERWTSSNGSYSRYLKASDKLDKVTARLSNCRVAQRVILAQSPVLVKFVNDTPICEYKAAYSIQKGGRISEIGGGSQSASQVFKERCMKRVPNVFNYDLKSSQAYILQQELQHCKIECSWLDDYINGTAKRVELARSAKLPISDWKMVFYALIMGAEIGNKFGDIYQHIKKTWHRTEVAEQIYRLETHFDPLINATAEWRDYLYYKKDRRYSYKHGGLKHWRNACDMKFKEAGLRTIDGKDKLIDRANNPINRPNQIDSCKRKLSAFILQGREACFIHHLTLILTENGIPVYRNEHDGLICGKKIPQKLIAKAGKKSGFNSPILVEKLICSDDKMFEYIEYLNE